jgi:hypothetical protein
LGLSVAQNDVSEIVAGFAITFAAKSWQQHMEEIKSITDFYLEKFRAIEAAAPADELDIAHSMVVHESALNTFARLELADDTKNSLADVVAQLKWPIPYLQAA